MKLLIVDDETLTREGLIASIDWTSLEISQVFQADDGVNGLQIAKREKPEIILCDVRMPRMDGIRMVELIEEFLPDSAVIFMSGYSDKEYLKAAIKLKAVNYVEKPLDPKEIREAVLEATERFRQKMRTRRNEAFHSMSTASALALALTRPYKEQKETVASLVEELGLRLAPSTAFTTYLVELGAEPETGFLDAVRERLEAYLTRRHLQTFHVSKQARYQIFHIYGAGPPSKTVLTDLDQFLAEQYQPGGDFYAARGETVCGLSRVHQSYAAAVALMQSSFFFESGQVLTPAEPESRKPAGLPGAAADQLAESLMAGDETGCGAILDEIFASFAARRDLFPHQAKDLYYKLFMALQESRQKRKLAPGTAGPGSIMESLERCFTLRELHRLLTEETKRFFTDGAAQAPEDPTVYLIKEFISRNYSDEALSVREISEHVHLSASYVCTYFKNETGQTLNQYLTAYRMEKAKQLLSDPRNQIADISDQVGYSNGNYFSKSFKKIVGLSPSEYREKMLQ